MHTIRLREPWQREWTQISGPTGGSRLALYQRHFHRPSGLLDQQVVNLVLHASRLVTSPAPLRISMAQNDQPDAQAADLSAAAPHPTILIHSILLNSQPLQTQMQLDPTQAATHFSVRINSALKHYNQLEIMCELCSLPPSPASTATDSERPIVEPASADIATPPPHLTHWAEVRIEIHD